MRSTALLASIALGLLTVPCLAQTVDEEAATALARKSNCFKCHALEKRKKAPSYKELAAKLKDKPDAEASLIRHLTESKVMKTDDGEDEPHATVATKDEKELVNLVRWLLSR